MIRWTGLAPWEFDVGHLEARGPVLEGRPPHVPPVRAKCPQNGSKNVPLFPKRLQEPLFPQNGSKNVPPLPFVGGGHLEARGPVLKGVPRTLRSLRQYGPGLHSSHFKNNHFTEMRCDAEAGSYLRLIDSCITQLKAQGPSRFCNESKEEE